MSSLRARWKSSPSKKKTFKTFSEKTGVTERGTRRNGFLSAAFVLLMSVVVGIVIHRHSDASETQLHAIHIDKHQLQVPDDARGFFPEGCVWRTKAEGNTRPAVAVTTMTPETKKRRSYAWRVRTYEYWDFLNNVWTEKRPKACVLDRERLVSDRERLVSDRERLVSDRERLVSDRERNWTTVIHDKGEYLVLENAWYNNGLFYNVQENDIVKSPFQMAFNMDMLGLTVKSVNRFMKSVNVSVARGETVLVDFVYFIHPTAIGHWLEYLNPIIGARRLEKLSANPPARFLIMHLKRTHIFEWVRAAIAATIGMRGHFLPQLIFQEETKSVWDQIASPFEDVPKGEWVIFEKVLICKDITMGGRRDAMSKEDAQLFRSRMHSSYGIQLEPLKKPVPQKITVLHKSANRRILNRDQLVSLLSAYGEVTEAEFTEDVPVLDQLSLIASTSILVSAHTSGLANAMFLPSGAAVYELIQRNWVWEKLDHSFLIQTRSLGDIHHFAWRAVSADEGQYINPNDQRRFGNDHWTGEMCDTEECVEAHTNIDLIVNITAFDHLLTETLPYVWTRAKVEDVNYPWP